MALVGILSEAHHDEGQWMSHRGLDGIGASL
jgi:hypothetical protein